MSTSKFFVTCFALLLLVIVPANVFAQGKDSKAKPTIPDSWMENFTWRSIGPANMSGRITSIAVSDQDPRIWYVASASGGLLKTTNNGINFEHLFDDQATVSIGDVQVSKKDPNLVWVGTGEANPRNSVSWGDGVYKSTDGGKTWKNMGLKKSFQIGKIAIHPENPDIVYVGALGRLWGPSEERGLFKTTDGGKTWEKVLFVDDNTGVIDVKMNPKDPDTLLVATYERKRDGFDGNDPVTKYGEGAAVYRTTDGGENFEKVSKGLPSCKMGRIGFDWYQKNPKIVYAIVESEKIASVPENRGYAGFTGEDADVGARITDVVADSPAEKGGLKVDDIVVQVDGELIQSYQDFLAELRRRKKGDEVKLSVSRDREPVDLVITLGKQPERRSRGNRRGRRQRNSEFTGTLGGQAANLQGQQGGENEEEFGGVYMSKDSGASWKRINTLNPRPMYYSQIRVDPSNNKNLYVLGTSLYRSDDGGETFQSDGGSGIHPDNHAMWIDPKMGDHIILGNDGGIYVTFDRMDNWDHYNHIAIGQFYHVGLDATRDYKVYGGLQDNGSWGGPAQTRSGGPTNTDWFRVGGGDGFITLVDPNDKDQIYFESQNGAMGRNNLRTGDRGFIRPRAPRGTRYRFNWKTPFILSPHNSKMHYSAGNYVFRSFDKGNGVKAISPEITNTDKGAGSAISESPVTAGVIYVGTTDGAVWMTRDGGKNWEEVFVQRESTDEDSEEGKSTSEESTSEDTKKSAKPAEATAKTSDDAKAEATTDRRPRGKRGRRGQRRVSESSETTEATPAAKAPADKPVDKTGNAEKAKAKAKAMKAKVKAEEAKAEEAKAEEAKAEKAKAEKAKAEKAKAEKAKAEKAKARKAKKAKAKESGDADAAVAKLVGTWKGELELDQIPEDQRWVEMTIARDADGVLSGEFETPRGVSTLSDFKFDAKNRSLIFTGANDNFDNVKFESEVGEKGDAITGQIDMGRLQVDFTVEKIDEGALQNISTPVFRLAGYRASAVQDTEDPVTGSWSAKMEAEEMGGTFEFTIEMKMDEDGNVTGLLSSAMGEMEIYDGTYNEKSKKLRMEVSSEESGMSADVVATVSDGVLKGNLSAGQGQFDVEFTAERTSTDLPEDETAAEEKTEPKAAAPAKAKAAPKKQEEAEPKAAEVTQQTPDADDMVTGEWEGKIISDSSFMQGDRAKLKMTLTRGKDGNVKGFVEMMSNENEISDGTFKDGKVEIVVETDRFEMTFDADVKDEKMTGELDFAGRRSFDFEAKRVSKTAGKTAEAEAPSAAAEKGNEKSLGNLVPGPRWVSSIEASHHKAGRVYLTLDGHRSNDDEPYLFISEDYGKTWDSIRANLPTSAGCTRVLREDIENENLLFLGCEFSAWVSVDRGKSWTRFQGGLPTVAVHEFAIHPSSGEIVAGTHGRSLWVCDISGLRKMSEEAMTAPVTLMEPNQVVRWRRGAEKGSAGTRAFVGENPDSNAEIFYYINEDAREASLTIHDLKGELIRTLDADASKGLHRVVWDLRRQPREGGQQRRGGRRGGGFGGGVPAGKYLVTLTVGGRDFKQVLEIQQDPAMPSAAVTQEEWELMKDLTGAGEESEIDD